MNSETVIETPFIRVFVIDDKAVFLSKEENGDDFLLQVRTVVTKDNGEFSDMIASYDFGDDEEARDESFEKATKASLKTSLDSITEASFL